MTPIKINDYDLTTADSNTVFVLDTNILYLVHAGYYTSAEQKDIAYSNFIKDLLDKGYKIIVSSLSLQELFFGIEVKEYKLHLSIIDKKPREFTKKDFRRDVSLREHVKEKMKMVMQEISATYEIKDGLVAQEVVEEYVVKCDKHQYDPIDYIMVDGLKNSSVIFVSEDKDFQFDDTIQVLYAE